MMLTHRWKRSGRCTTGSCFEWLELPVSVVLRDSKMNHIAQQPTIVMDRATWAAFQAHFTQQPTEAVNSARFGSVEVTEGSDDGWVDVTDASTGVTLSFDGDEVAAFAAGVADDDVVAVA